MTDVRMAGGLVEAAAMAQWAVRHGTLADFLFRSVDHGETLLVCGDRAVAVSQMRRPVPSTSVNRELAWFTEQIAAAGRRLDAGLPEAQRFTSERGGGLYLDPAALTWSGLLIIDHPAPPPGVEMVWSDGRRPLVVLLRRDWELVVHELRSAAAVVRFLDWCAGLGPTEVPAHFGWLALACERPPRALTGPAPALPLIGEDLPGHAVIGRILEFVSATALPGALNESVRHRLLSQIDAFPLEERAALGEWTAAAVREAGTARDPAAAAARESAAGARDSAAGARDPGTVPAMDPAAARVTDVAREPAAAAVRPGGAARVRTFRFPGAPAQYVLAVAGSFTESLSGPFHDLVRLRHHEVLPASTFGFALVPDGDASWPYLIAHFTCVQGPSALDTGELTRIRRTWRTLSS
ncbi:hypothetical protein AB0M02_22040 [Actinoplanes sp. NPDC051861]|uniref:hypothetical protein n=1 Tax=Actinoplanes sp. NPDC051861 TaxID=3155170 RepID=UPI00341CF9DD